MDIYLDIDGVILGTYSPLEDCIEFLEYLLVHFPDTTYWLTTHCKGGENHTGESLSRIYQSELVDKIEATFKETDWGVLKTDAIDFSRPFVWFDDTLYQSEKMVLTQHGAEDGYYKIDPEDPEAIKRALDHLRQIKKAQ
ncbi:hypothetical protein FWF89_02040 [Candidatus Saccharibacteria bacterium]|jgi:hypothetical protein|nr:hypothetical protein [Candidatus Saccharibacteria bacterium]